jgi:hypothetical protein
MCLRVKRGLKDTSQPGGCCKDQAYLAGVLKLLIHRKDFSMRLLYSGRVPVECIKAAQHCAILDDSITLPSFVLETAAYEKVWLDIIQCNGLNVDCVKLVDIPSETVVKSFSPCPQTTSPADAEGLSTEDVVRVAEATVKEIGKEIEEACRKENVTDTAGTMHGIQLFSGKIQVGGNITRQIHQTAYEYWEALKKTLISLLKQNTK